MKKNSIIAVLLVLISVLALSACGVLQEPAAPSAPIEAIPLDTQAEGVVEEAAPAEEAAPTEEPAPAEEAAPTEEPAPAEEAAPTEEPAPAEEAAAAGARIFTITPAGSQVRFELDEDLRGERITVVGVTDQVAGELSLDLANLAQTQIGIIQINARGLMTDNNFRNRAIQNEILETGQWEFITFTPSAVEGLPDSAAVGDTVTFRIAGVLTIRDVSLPATFTVEATAASDSQLTGTAATVINRNDFGLRIPSVPSVANVEEEVELYIDFTANGS